MQLLSNPESFVFVTTVEFPKSCSVLLYIGEKVTTTLIHKNISFFFITKRRIRCVCVCVYEWERERETDKQRTTAIYTALRYIFGEPNFLLLSRETDTELILHSRTGTQNGVTCLLCWLGLKSPSVLSTQFYCLLFPLWQLQIRFL